MLHLLASVVGYDVWFYLSHLLLHTRALWWLHAEHHSSPAPLHFMDTYKGHWLEGIFQGAGLFVPFIWWSYSWMDVALLLAFVNVRGMLRHDARAVWLVGDYHLLHHENPTKNYGEGWLDWLGGTQFTPHRMSRPLAAVIGLD